MAEIVILPQTFYRSRLWVELFFVEHSATKAGTEAEQLQIVKIKLCKLTYFLTKQIFWKPASTGVFAYDLHNY
jgi:hypothetical protein